MWLDKDNIETLYAPKKRNYKKELFEGANEKQIKSLRLLRNLRLILQKSSRVFVKSHVKFSLKAERNLMMK